MVLVVGGQGPLLVDMAGGIDTGIGLGSAVGLVGAQLGVFPLDAVLTWLLVVTLDLPLATRPTRSAWLRQRHESVQDSQAQSPSAGRTIANFAMRVDDSVGFLGGEVGYVWAVVLQLV